VTILLLIKPREKDKKEKKGEIKRIEKKGKFKKSGRDGG
jgi:hypothetical protein